MKMICTLLVAGLLACNQQAKKITAEPDPSLYDAKTACLLSQVVYCADEQKAMDKYMPGWKLVWEPAEINGNHAIVATNGNLYALAIRGSLMTFSWAAFQNWVYQDLNVASLQPWGHTNDSSAAKVSQGAWDGWQNLQQMKDTRTGKTLLAFLEEHVKEETPLLITGHSLGGNLASVYASYCWQYFTNKKKPRKYINVINFAAPAAGNKAFAADFDKKFPQSRRYENTNDIVPKFPCTSRVSALGELYNASSVMVGYKGVTVSLSKVFSLINTALSLLEWTGTNATYCQTNGEGTLITLDLSGQNNQTDIGSWLSEAGYHHGIARYAKRLGVEEVICE